MIGSRAWAAYAIVFVASAGTLVLEIAAGRLLASYFGVSLYTWTSIIGVVLAGISVGNYLGGTVADLAGTRRTLGLVLATAGMSSLAILPFTTIDLLGLIPRGLPLVARMVLAIGILFFAPSALLGMVSPLVVKLTLANLGHAGHVVGRIYASDVPGTLVLRPRTYVIAASATAVDVERVRRLPWQGPDGETTVGVMPSDAMTEWLRVANPVLLTDDYAPADNLLAPIFLERGF